MIPTAPPAPWPSAVLHRVQRWLAEAEANEPAYPNAATLATCDGTGRVSVRVMLVKSVDERGLVFFTNSTSRKGLDLSANPQAALNFHWKSLARQLRFEGFVEKIADAESDAYFASRPRTSQLGAWASLQSQAMRTANALEQRLAEVEERFAGQPVPRPPYWFGYRLLPGYVEFWQEGSYRLHQRDVWQWIDGQWRTQQKFP